MERVVFSKIGIEIDGVNHPPRMPASKLGPFFQFVRTDLKEMLWIGSALILQHISLDQPKIEFTCQTKVNFNWEILYENLFDFRIFRVNLFLQLMDNDQDEKINWKLIWNDKETNEGCFVIAHYRQQWRGGFFSCNGFGVAVSKEIPLNLNSSNVWNHLLSIHDQNPFHLLIWGGDQNYMDFLFEDIPFIRHWIDMEWNEKWTCQFTDQLREQVEQYYFNAYAESWNCRREMKLALESIPSVMMWDDHDIFDGAGTYPTLLRHSPMMMGLFVVAQKMRLLFQHHTTLEKARQHRLFGFNGYNFLIRCGPHLAILGGDGRTERDLETIQHEQTWNMIFDRLDNEIDDIEHLIVVFPVPFSFIRVRLVESILEHLKNLPNRCRNLPIVKQTNSIFGLPDPYDDLRDEWTHQAHIQERNCVLQRFQQFSQKKKIRVTYFSGDVHCCAVSRFQTKKKATSAKNDHRLMYQIISSAIVNLPPSPMAIRLAHLFQTKWTPLDQTQEELIDFFHNDPFDGSRLSHRKIRSNRNWCYFEQVSSSTIFAPIVVETSCSQCLPSKQIHPINNNNNSNQQQNHYLKIQLWLEGIDSNRDQTNFTAYDLFIPNLQ